MFTRVRQLWSRLTGPRRDIFVYRSGLRTRRIDPWLALQSLWTYPDQDFELVLKRSSRGEVEGQRELERIIRDVFKVQEYNGETGDGLTVLEVHDLHRRFAIYVSELKKKLDTSPTQSPPSGSRSSATPPPLTMKPESDSCSTADASSSAEPTSSSEPSSRPPPVKCHP